MRRLMPLVLLGLVAILAVIWVGVWNFEALRTERAENGGAPAVPACDPNNTVGKAILPNCPDASITATQKR
ncbi:MULTISPECIES: hypothetical protein [Methylobacterium]|uniref:Uncharacterized protein n=1 Tax=Methylobacterium bullatum TaxID=570505 RepID=A0A679KF22_9HYPH|nr:MULTISPECIES: hypothetical protein [Methylobacterium]TXN26441.1 hypothetical protein FV220_15010 [Methylobacterium sp. WL19]GJD39351.1 hypothetical protein OICFNHDK_1810 [Methylobacterium bullatum]CAA2143074.1 hypothetical protein MBLL_02637 [Methylobacterium bullatum]